MTVSEHEGKLLEVWARPDMLCQALLSTWLSLFSWIRTPLAAWLPPGLSVDCGTCWLAHRRQTGVMGAGGKEHRGRRNTQCGEQSRAAGNKGPRLARGTPFPTLLSSAFFPSWAGHQFRTQEWCCRGQVLCDPRQTHRGVVGPA